MLCVLQLEQEQFCFAVDSLYLGRVICCWNCYWDEEEALPFFITMGPSGLPCILRSTMSGRKHTVHERNAS